MVLQKVYSLVIARSAATKQSPDFKQLQLGHYFAEKTSEVW